MHNKARSLAIMVALTLSGLAHADSWEQPNTAGGKIVLTDRACADGKAKNLLTAYAYTKAGAVTNGCWGMLDAHAHISWDDGRTSVFPMDVFTANTANKQASRRPAVNAPL